MFCTQCGTEVDAGKNFCKNCGARVGRGAIAPAETVGPSVSTGSGDQMTRKAADSTGGIRGDARGPAPLKEGTSSRTILFVAGVLLLLLAGGGAYFMTGSSKPPIEPVLAPAPPAQEPVASKAAESQPLPSFQESSDISAGGESPSAALPKFDPEPEPPLDKPKPAAVESARKSSPDALPPSSRSQAQKTGQDAARGRPATVPTSRGGANPGTYETVRSTPVHEDPSASSRVVANIPAGVRVNVVSSSGDWLEIHSRRGNPPGFIRRGDATSVDSSN